jgi:hypothetical protein
MATSRRIVPTEVTVTRIQAIAAVLVALISTCGGVLLGRYFQPKPILPELPATTTTTTPIPQFRFESPSPEGHDVTMTCTIDVHGSGDLPPGKALAIATQEAQDPIRFFEGTVQWKADHRRWEANVQLGDNDSAGHLFTIYAVVLDEDLAKYLVSTNRTAGDTHWSSPGQPPGSAIAAQVDVRRSPNPSVSCAP